MLHSGAHIILCLHAQLTPSIRSPRPHFHRVGCEAPRRVTPPEILFWARNQFSSRVRCLRMPATFFLGSIRERRARDPETSCPKGRVIVPDELEILLEQVGAERFQVIAQQIPPAAPLAFRSGLRDVSADTNAYQSIPLRAPAPSKPGLPERVLHPTALFICCSTWKRSRTWRPEQPCGQSPSGRVFTDRYR